MSNQVFVPSSKSLLDIDHMMSQVKISLRRDNCSLDPELVLQALIDINNGVFHRKGYGESKMLRFLETFNQLEIPLCDESQSFKETSLLSTKTEHRLNHRLPKTITSSPKTVVQVFETIKETPSYFHVYEELLSMDRGNPCLTEHQVIEFVNMYPHILLKAKRKRASFFIHGYSGSLKEVSVAQVTIKGGELFLYADGAKRVDNWNPDPDERFVVNQRFLEF